MRRLLFYEASPVAAVAKIGAVFPPTHSQSDTYTHSFTHTHTNVIYTEKLFPSTVPLWRT